MKPVSWIFLIIAVILVVIGMLMCSVASLQAKRQGIDLFDTKVVNGQSQAEHEFADDVINKVQIEVSDCDVNIICGSNTNKVIMNNFSSAGYICEVENRALVIEDTVNIFDVKDIIENGKIRFKGFRYYLRDRKITTGSKSLDLYISDKYDIKIIEVSVKNGDVNISGYENNTDYIVSITKGKLTASDIVTGSEVKATVEKGSVTMHSVKAKTINMTVDEGNINAVLSAKEITADAKKGSILLESESDLSNYNFVLRAPDSTITLESLVKAGNYIANDAQLTNFIHASAGGGSVTVKSYIAPLSPIDIESSSSGSGSGGVSE